MSPQPVVPEDGTPIYSAADVAAMLAEERAAAVRFVRGQRSTWEAAQLVEAGKHREPPRAAREPTARTPETSCTRPEGDAVQPCQARQP